MTEQHSGRTDIFREYFSDSPFIDRFSLEQDRAITVIIPVIHSNALWRKNLESFYREIPVQELILADGGCIDDTVKIAEEFPRVRVLDHRDFRTLGYSIRGLIEEVSTEWFAYLQSDVFLPPGWFDEMWSHTSEYDWFGCKERHTVMVEYDGEFGERPWAGSQIGRKEAFGSGLFEVEDDYVYRQEDYVFANIVKRGGFREGKVSSTFHYHQTCYKESPFFRKIAGVQVNVQPSQAELERMWTMHARGIVKYLPADSWPLALEVAQSNRSIKQLGLGNEGATLAWIRETNPSWLWKVIIATWALALDGLYLRLVFLPRTILKKLLSRSR